MARRSSQLMPAVERLIVGLGHNIRMARQRRQISAQLLAERAGMSRPTLRAIERGDWGVTIGAVANVLHSLGLEKDLAGIARDDDLARKLHDVQLATIQRVRNRNGDRTKKR